MLYTLRLMLQTLSFGFCAGVPIARSAWEVRMPSLATLDRTSLAFTTSTASNFLHIPIKMQTHPVWTRGTKNLDLMTSLFDLFGNSEKVPYYITALPTSVFRIFHFSLSKQSIKLCSIVHLRLQPGRLMEKRTLVLWLYYRPLSNFASE